MSTGQHRTEASEEYRAALLQESSPGVVARILQLDSLLRMRAEAGRGKDLADINELIFCTEERAAMTSDEESTIDWNLTTWRGSRLQQHREFLALPFRRKLELIEEMDDHGRRTLEWRKASGLPYIDPFTGHLVRGSAAQE